MKEWLLARDYSKNVVNEQFIKVFFDIPFVVKLIRDLLLFLHRDEEVQKIFLSSVMASYKSPRKKKRLNK